MCGGITYPEITAKICVASYDRKDMELVEKIRAMDGLKILTVTGSLYDPRQASCYYPPAHGIVDRMAYCDLMLLRLPLEDSRKLQYLLHEDTPDLFLLYRGEEEKQELETTTTTLFDIELADELLPPILLKYAAIAGVMQCVKWEQLPHVNELLIARSPWIHYNHAGMTSVLLGKRHSIRECLDVQIQHMLRGDQSLADEDAHDEQDQTSDRTHGSSVDRVEGNASHP